MPRSHRITRGDAGAWFYDRCPWSAVATDSAVDRYLSAYALLERWGQAPVGGNDPRFWEAVTVIASEHAAIDREALEKKDGDYA